MKSKFFIGPALYFFACFYAGAQPVRNVFDHIYDKLPNVVFNDVFQTLDGRWVVIGVEREKTGASVGAAFVLGDSGAVVQQKRFAYPHKRFNALLAGVQADNGVFYFAGKCGGGASDSESWLVALDAAGREKLLDTTYRDLGAGFVKALTSDDGEVVLIGQSAGLGDICLLKISREGRQESVAASDGEFGKIADAQIDGQGNISVFGDAVKKKGIFWAVFDRSLRLISQKTYTGIEQLVCAGLEPDGKASIFGHTNRKGASEIVYGLVAKDVFLESKTGITDRNAQFLTAAARAPDGRWVGMLGLKEKPSLRYRNRLAYLEGDPDRNQIGDFGYDRDFFATGLYAGLQNTVMVCGEAGGRGAALQRLACLQTGPAATAKAETRLACLAPKLAGGGSLAPNQRAFIEFEVENTGDAAIGDGKIEVRISQGVEGLSLPWLTQLIKYLPAGAKQRCAIPVYGAPNLAFGEAELGISATVHNQAYCRQVLRLKTGRQPAAGWQRAEMEGDSRVRSRNPQYALKGKIWSPRVAAVQDVKLFRDGAAMPDGKAESVRFSGKPVSGGFVYTYERTVELREGENVFFIGADTIVSEKQTVVYEPRKPALRVLTLAPQSDLKYNVKDARDFAEAMERQRALYSDIRIDSMNDFFSTTGARIQTFFENLATQEKDDPNLSAGDVLIVFISSHGMGAKNEDFKILASDYKFGDEKRTVVDYRKEILEPLKNVKCKILILIDACHSGGAGPNAKGEPSDFELGRAMNEISAAAPGIAVVCSSGSDESSYELPNRQNGAFTCALLEALQNTSAGGRAGADADGDGFLSLRELFNYVAKRTSELAGGVKEKQTPAIYPNNIDDRLRLFLAPTKFP